ncbi:MAG: SEC-C domain-containing protein [Acidobacteriota bacterium]|nr:MAG: SEC-C domain-containing protein [Acidobacteriota bacterium]
MKSQAGQNDPCPCGSGKKYKKCCLAKRSVIDFESARFHRLDVELMKRLLPTVDVFLKKAARERAEREFWPRRGARLEDDAEARLFAHWLLYDWMPDERLWRARVSVPKDGTVVDAFLDAHGYTLDDDLREAAGALLRMPNGFHEVIDVEPGRALFVREIFLGLDFTVEERTGSRQLKRGDIVFGKVVSWRGTFVLAGSGEMVISPACKGLLLDCRQEMRDEFDTLFVMHLRLMQDALRLVYLDIRHQLFHPAPPKLSNTDGDPLLFHELRYAIDSPHEAALALAVLDEQAARRDEDPFESCRRDALGRIVEASISWNRCEPGVSAGADSTILGSIRISHRVMTVEVNSKRRASRIQREIKRLLGKRARLEATSIEDADTMLERAASVPPTPDSLRRERESRELNERPEVQAMLRRTLEKHYHAWIDERLPALRGRTPREAVADSDGRERVEALLLEAERGQAGKAGVDFTRIRRELGLL